MTQAVLSPKKVTQKKIDIRITRTNHLLSQALQDILGEKCFTDITIQDILEKSTVNRATFYAHFDDKDALLRFVLSNIFEKKLRQRLPENASPSKENLILLILGVCDFLNGICCCPKLSTIQTNPSVEGIMKPVVHQILRDWVATQHASEPEKSIEGEIQAAATAWSICGATLQWSQSGPAIPAEEFVEKIYPLICPGTRLLFPPA